MNRLVLRLSIIITLGILTFTDAVAQNYAHKFGLEITGGIREYGGDRGTRYFFAQRPDYQAVGISFGYYVNPSFDALLFGSTGDLGHRDVNRLGFTAQISEVMLGVRYKFANNYMLSEQSRVRPFLQAGWGGMQSVSKIIHNVPGYPQNRTWIAAHWAAGGGVKIRLTDYLDFSLQSFYNYSYDDNYDGLPFSMSKVRLSALHDAYLFHSAGFTFNFGPDNGNYVVKEEKEVIPQEVIDKVNFAAKNINFETASAVIKTSSYADLDTVVAILKLYPTIDAFIEGHTDNVGNDESNMTLSQKRAESVRTYITNKGIENLRLTAKGYGETQPVADNGTPEGRASNRRVEIKLFYRN